MSSVEILKLSVSEFIALTNQTLEYAMPLVIVEGEISSFRVSKGRWVYFDLKDEQSSVRCFGTVYQLKTAIEDGMMVKVTGNPRLHNQYGFSLNIQQLVPSGEGSLRRAFELLQRKLTAEGLFNPARKRPLPVIPERIGLITSSEAAAFADFTKVLSQRWGGLDIQLANVHVQGPNAPGEIVRAIEYFNKVSEPVDVIVVTRGGGSLEDLQAFNTEEVVRAIVGSRTPTIVGVGHETDTSLSDLAADVRAATPSNAAQLLVPDREDFKRQVDNSVKAMGQTIKDSVALKHDQIGLSLSFLERQLRAPSQRVGELLMTMDSCMSHLLKSRQERLAYMQRTLANLDPKRLLRQGYSLARDQQGRVVRSAKQLSIGDKLVLEFYKDKADVEVTNG